MVYKRESHEDGWFRGTPILGNPHIKSCNPSHQVTTPEQELRLDGVASSSGGASAATGGAGAGPGVVDMARGARTRPRGGGKPMGNHGKNMDKLGFRWVYVGFKEFNYGLPVKMLSFHA